jgi:predicted KAP-like P-loop ATPase
MTHLERVNRRIERLRNELEYLKENSKYDKRRLFIRAHYLNKNARHDMNFSQALKKCWKEQKEYKIEKARRIEEIELELLNIFTPEKDRVLLHNNYMSFLTSRKVTA